MPAVNDVVKLASGGTGAPPPAGCWAPGIWSENYYACTFMDGGSTFLSRKGFLGASATIPAGQPPCVAETNATILTAGLFAPLVRFEPLCRAPACFETQFGLTILQNGTTKFNAVYGALGSLSLRSKDGTVIDHAATSAVGETVILLRTPLPLAGVSTGLEREVSPN